MGKPEVKELLLASSMSDLMEMREEREVILLFALWEYQQPLLQLEQ